MSSSSPAHRHGMVFVDDEGEYDSLRQFIGTSESEDSDDDYAHIDSSDSSSYHSENDDLAEYWDPYLYQLQMRAPRPNCIPCLRELPDRPPFYGEEYHGSITREETARLLGTHDGNYLVRRGLSQSGTYSLSFVFGGQVRHYRLYQEGQYHYVGEKPFDTIEDLVHDGLITLYMEANNVEQYLQSAKESITVHIASNVPEEYPSSGNGAVFGEESNESVGSPPAPTKTSCLPRRPPYYRCTIPVRRDRVHAPVHVYGQELERIYEEVSEEQTAEVLQNGVTTLPLDPRADTLDRKESSLYFHYEKPHNFKLHNYIGLPWCDYCRNFMWGLRNQGHRCKDCGYNAHKQCKDEVASDCHPSRQLVKRVYGVELTTLVKMHGTKVPVVVKDCVEEIERRGLCMEGLYRVSGKTNDILRLKKQFDNDVYADLSVYEDIHALTGALKLYLRELPIPLMTFDAYDLCLIAARSNSTSESLDMLRVALSRLPPAHYNTLRHLLRHLYKLQRMKDGNKMDAKNLAVVFTPTLMRSPYNNSGIMAIQKLPQQKKAIEMLITNFHDLFQ